MMNKKEYQKPTMWVVKMEHKTALLTSSILQVGSSDTGIDYGGGGSGPARARIFDDWDDWGDWGE